MSTRNLRFLLTRAGLAGVLTGGSTRGLRDRLPIWAKHIYRDSDPNGYR